MLTENNDLINLATKAAIEEGSVPGGGVALVRGASALSKIQGENANGTFEWKYKGNATGNTKEIYKVLTGN